MYIFWESECGNLWMGGQYSAYHRLAAWKKVTQSSSTTCGQCKAHNGLHARSLGLID